MRRSLALFATTLLVCPLLMSLSPHLEKTIPLPDGVRVQSTVISPAGDFLAAASGDNKVRLWKVASGEWFRTLDLGGQDIGDICFSKDGRYLALGGGKGLVRAWELSSATLKLEFTSSNSINRLAFPPDATLLAAAPLEGAVEVWDLAAGKQIARMKAPFSGTSALAFSPDGHWLATADGDTAIRVYDARTGALRSSNEDFLLEAFTIAYSADGKSIYTGGADKTISVLDANTAKTLRSFPKQKDVLFDLRVSPNGKLLAAAYFDQNAMSNISPVEIWDLETQSPRILDLGPGVAANGGEFVSDERLLVTSGSEKELKVWSVR